MMEYSSDRVAHIAQGGLERQTGSPAQTGEGAGSVRDLAHAPNWAQRAVLHLGDLARGDRFCRRDQRVARSCAWRVGDKPARFRVSRVGSRHSTAPRCRSPIDGRRTAVRPSSAVRCTSVRSPYSLVFGKPHDPSMPFSTNSIEFGDNSVVVGPSSRRNGVHSSTPWGQAADTMIGRFAYIGTVDARTPERSEGLTRLNFSC